MICNNGGASTHGWCCSGLCVLLTWYTVWTLTYFTWESHKGCKMGPSQLSGDSHKPACCSCMTKALPIVYALFAQWPRATPPMNTKQPTTVHQTGQAQAIGHMPMRRCADNLASVTHTLRLNVLAATLPAQHACLLLTRRNHEPPPLLAKACPYKKNPS